MEEIRIKIPHELEFIKKVPNVDWTILVSKIIRDKLEEIVRLKRGLSKSKLTKKDVEEFTDKINTALSKRYLE